MAKYEFDLKEEQLSFYQVKELLKFLISLLNKKGFAEIDDSQIKIPNNIKQHFKQK